MIFQEVPTDPKLLKKLCPKSDSGQLATSLEMDEVTLMSSRWVVISTRLGVAVDWFAAILMVQYHKAINSEWVSFPNLY